MTDQSKYQPLKDAPLDGVRVLDLAPGSLGAVGRVFAELGAQVIRVEPRAGGADRVLGASLGGVSLGFAAANLGKRGVALDLTDAADREAFEALAASADILIEATTPDSADAKALDVKGLCARHPALVALSISGFGGGAFAHWQATDPVLHALSGGLSRSGIPDMPPLLPPGELAIQCACAQGAFVTLSAYYNRLLTGQGDHLDLALLDGATQALDPGFGISGSATFGVPMSKLPRGRPEARFQYPIIPCKDGFVRLCVLAPRQWQGLFEWMGRPEEFADPSFNATRNRYKSKTLIPKIGELFADKTRVELENAGQKHGVPTAAVLTLDEALATDHIKARNAVIPVEIAPGVIAQFPNGLMEIDGQRAGVQGPPPKVGQDNDTLLGKAADKGAAAGKAAANTDRPFAGLKVLDLGVIVVGAEQSRLLADLGADVIKLENAGFPDGSRQTRDDSKMSVTFAAGHRNKRSLGLNLRDPEGQALFLKLVEQADVVLSNFKPGTLDSLGLGPDKLRQINPRLILSDSSAFGSSGPWSKRMGYGPLVRAAAGLTLQWRYPNDPDSFSDAMTVYPDHVAGRVGATGVVALLIRRLRTQTGGAVSISQAEVMLSQMSAYLAAATAAPGAVEGGPARDAPWGVFPAAGDDEWCVVSVRNDADFQALCQVIERPDLAADPALATPAGRDAQRARLDEALTAWLAKRGPGEAMAALQSAGVPAGAMLRTIEQPDFAYFAERGFFRLATHPMLEEPFYLENAAVRSTRLADPALGPAPALGEHTVELARDWLGLAPAEITRLIDSKVLEVLDAA